MGVVLRQRSSLGIRSRSVRRLRFALLGVPVLLIAGLFLSFGASAGHAGEAPPALPRIGAVQEVDNADVADPSILAVTPPGQAVTTYYRFGTTDWQSNVPTAVSTDLLSWHAAPDAFPMLPQWAAPSISMTWAPSVLAVHGRYVLYVTTEEASSGRQCISLATSSSPGGPYVDAARRPFECQRDRGGSIDPTAFRDGTGGLHLAWKNDGNCCGLPTAIWEQDLSRDGLRLMGPAHRLLSADQAWQFGNIEAPALTPATGHGWWLFYSGGSWRTAQYATGVAFCPTLQGPCREVLNRPFVASTAGLRTPGGLETFHDRSGGTWVAFTSTVEIPSRRRPGRYYLNRVMDIAPLLTS